MMSAPSSTNTNKPANRRLRGRTNTMATAVNPAGTSTSTQPDHEDDIAATTANVNNNTILVLSPKTSRSSGDDDDDEQQHAKEGKATAAAATAMMASSFVVTTRTALETLVQDHGYSRERAVATLLQEIQLFCATANSADDDSSPHHHRPASPLDHDQEVRA